MTDFRHRKRNQCRLELALMLREYPPALAYLVSHGSLEQDLPLKALVFTSAAELGVELHDMVVEDARTFSRQSHIKESKPRYFSFR